MSRSNSLKSRLEKARRKRQEDVWNEQSMENRRSRSCLQISLSWDIV